ncbi:MAG: HAMP domain-containing protein [Candidatus Competibacteraceae bacterium]|nr:HAMP domain-containing protein [Candidatus Competibacteraceae bacterium]
MFAISRNSGDANDPVRVLRTPLISGYYLLVGRDLNDERTLLNHNLKLVIIVITLILLLALVGSIILGRQTLRRIDAVNRTAQAIMAGDLSQRIASTRRNNEFDELGRTLNTMLERIEQLMTGMRQVTENIAHDLRSPLNRMRNRMEVTLLEPREPAEYQTVLEQNVADTDALIQTFNALLSIAQAEAGLQRDWAEQDLSALGEDLADLYSVLAEEQNKSFNSSVTTDCLIQGNRQLLAQALSNLLDNAVKYTPDGGRIELRVERIDGRATVTVADSGPGIPFDQRDKVTERFFRLDSARSSPGNGLGLSLVKAVAKQHGAQLILEDNQPGLRVTLRFRR